MTLLITVNWSLPPGAPPEMSVVSVAPFSTAVPAATSGSDNWEIWEQCHEVLAEQGVWRAPCESCTLRLLCKPPSAFVAPRD